MFQTVAVLLIAKRLRHEQKDQAPEGYLIFLFFSTGCS
jgi:hypothetical protein